MKPEELFDISVNCSNGKCSKNSTKVISDVDHRNRDLDDEMQDLYGSRIYGLPTPRPTMISAKYRQKEERRKVLKLSMNKLKRIEDPESSLRRSVLINNTVKRLQREAKEEKLQKNCITASSSVKCFGITNDFIVKQEENMKPDLFASSAIIRISDQLLDITNLPDGKTYTKYNNDCLDCDEAISELTFHGERVLKSIRKRPIEEALEEECDVLSQFYLPPTPRIIPLLQEDEEEDVNVVDVDTAPSALLPVKKKRGCDSYDTLSTSSSCLTAADRLRDNLSPSVPLPSSSPVSSSTTSISLCASLSSSSFSSSAIPAMPLSSSAPHFSSCFLEENILSPTSIQTGMLQPILSSTPPSPPFSCGHSSMLNEIVVYHNLIASLES